MHGEECGAWLEGWTGLYREKGTHKPGIGETRGFRGLVSGDHLSVATVCLFGEVFTSQKCDACLLCARHWGKGYRDNGYFLPWRHTHSGGMTDSLSRVWLSATSQTVAQQAPLSMACSRQEYWSGLSFPSPEDLPDPGIEPGSPALQADCLPSDRPDRHKLKHQKSMAISPRAVWGGVPWWFTCSAPAHLRELCLWGGATSVCRGLQVVSTATGQGLSYLLKSAFFKGLNIKKEVSSCFNTEKETCFKPGL